MEGAGAAAGGEAGVDGVASRVFCCLIPCDGIRGCTAHADDRVRGTAVEMKRPAPVGWSWGSTICCQFLFRLIVISSASAEHREHARPLVGSW